MGSQLALQSEGSQLEQRNQNFLMDMKRLARSVVSYGVAAVMGLQGLGALLPSATHAASPLLRLSEINWAGSTTGTADQWIELKNISAVPIIFNDATPYQLMVGGTTYTLGTSYGILPAGEYLVIHRLALGASTIHNVGTTHYHQEPTLNLPLVPTEYRIIADDGSVTDEIPDPDGAGPLQPEFKGTLGTPATPPASMTRPDQAVHGLTDANWYTSRVTGAGFNIGAPTQYGTPGLSNVDFAAPTGLVTPPLSTVLSAPPTVSGTIPAGVDSVTVRFTRVSHDPNPLGFTREYTVPAGSPTYSVTASSPDLLPGRYVIDVFGTDTVGNRSVVVRIPNTVGGTEYDYTVFPESSLVPAPLLNPLPPLTNQSTLTVTGTLHAFTSYHSLEVYRNGAYYSTVLLNDVGTFSFPVILVPNQSNLLQVVGVTVFGEFSNPASATVVHDSLAPNPVNLSKVTLNANPPGTADTFLGQPGAAEAATTLYVYGDTAQTNLIATVTVAADGSFPLVNIGDNQYATVYLVLQDAAGNRSAAAALANPIGFTTGGILMPTITDLQATQVSLKWNAVPGATKYRIKYKQASGSYGATMDLCLTGNAACSFATTIKDLFADTDYVIALAAVDQYGNTSNFEEVSFRTKQVAVSAPATPAIGGGTGTLVVARKTDRISRTAPTPTPTATATPVPSPTPSEEGDVQSAATSRNWTPWIVLGVLVAIAVLATAGYFYWFGGEAGEAALASVMAERAKREEEAKSSKTPKKKGGSRRW